MADFDLSQLQGLLGSFAPSEDDRDAAKKSALLMAGLSLLGSRKGQEWDRVGYAGQNALQQYQGQLAAGPKMRQENIKGAMEIQKMLKDAQMQNMAMGLIGGGTPSAGIPERAGPPSPDGQQATYAPPQQPQGGQGGGMPYSAAAEQGWAILNPKVADVLHRQNEITQGPQGTLMRNGQIVGQVLKNGMVVNGQFTPLPPEALDLEATQAAKTAGMTTAAEEAARLPGKTITGPYGANGAQVTGYQTDIIGRPGGAPAAQGDGLASIMPRNDQEAASLVQLLGSRGIGARYVKQGDQFVPGPGHGQPLNAQQGASGPDPLKIKQAERDIATQGSQDSEIATAFGKDYVGIVNSERQAPVTIGKLNMLKDHLAKVETGKMAPTIQNLKAVAAYVAPELTKNWTKDVPYAQAAEQLSNEMALQLRNPTTGPGMPGSISDGDRKFLIAMTANIGNDPRAIPMMLDARIAVEKRAQEVGKMAREYRAANGKIDEGFYAQVAQYADSHPLFASQAQAQGQGGGAKPGVVDFSQLPKGR